MDAPKCIERTNSPARLLALTHLFDRMFIDFFSEPPSYSPLASFSAQAPWLDWCMPLGWLGAAGSGVLATGLVLLCLALWALNVVALPGNWFCVALLSLYAWWGPSEGRAEIGWGPLVAAFALALLGELVEFLAGAVGASRAGASRRSTVYALLGSIIGAVAGLFVGLPIPLLGPAVAAILFAGLGAAVGAMLGERSSGRSWGDNWAVGRAAFWGRTFGTLGKAAVGLGIVVVAVLGVLL